MKKILLSTLLLTLISGNSLAQIPFPDKDELYQAMLEKIPYEPEDLFLMSDVDNNQKLSRNEINEMSKGSFIVPALTEEEKQTLADKIIASFDKFDKNKDEFLDKEESIEYFKNVLKEIVETTAENQARFFKSLEAKNPQEVMNFLNEKQKEALDSIEKVTQQLNDSKNFSVDDLLINQTRQSAEEEFFQGDTNKDGKLDKQEFIAYQNLTNDDSYIQQYTTQKYEDDFNKIDTAQKGYITKDEYIKHATSDIQKIITPQEIEEDFKEIDTNQDGKLDKQEYITYLKQGDEELSLSDGYEYNFNEIDTDKKGYLTKEEYIENRIQETKNLLKEY